jgi:uncharacterized damage-inducible protein DinB
MKKEIESIIRNLQNTLEGEPWFGRAVYELLGEIDESKTSVKPNSTEHSLLELLWHMNTWAEFTLAHLENRSADELTAIEQNDWKAINPEKHNWKNGVEQLKSVHEKIISILKQKEDDFLKEPVPNREFNFRFMLNGLIQHNIYHAGQIAYIKKLLKA